jgi:hypothetical protein
VPNGPPAPKISRDMTDQSDPADQHSPPRPGDGAGNAQPATPPDGGKSQPGEPQPGETQPPTPQYRGEPLDPDRGPGLGCFWIQMALLGTLLVATPLSVALAVAPWISAVLLIATLLLLLFVGQTTIFLLRLVAADRRTRRRPLAGSARKTVGQLEDEAEEEAEPEAEPEPPGEPGAEPPGEAGTEPAAEALDEDDSRAR